MITKPKSLRMKLHEVNRPPEYLQAYPADEMDAYLACIEEENADYVQALSLLDGAEEVIEMHGYKAEHQAGKQWAIDWLMKARGLIASYLKSKEARNGK